MKGRLVLAAAAVGSLTVAGCSSSSSSSAASGGGTSGASASHQVVHRVDRLRGPDHRSGGPARRANSCTSPSSQCDRQPANKTKITLVQGDTQLNPAQATTVTQQFISNTGIVAVVGPAGSQEVKAVGPAHGPGRAGVHLRLGDQHDADYRKDPTFFRVVSKDSVQGPQDANYIVSHLHPKAIMIVDDQEVYSTGLVSSMIPMFQKAGIKVDHESVSQKVTDFSSLVAKVTPDTTVVVLPWQLAVNAQQFGRNLQQQHKSAVIFGTDGLFDPKSFTISGSYVSTFGPDITAIPADAAIVAAATSKWGNFSTFGPPTFAATHVIDEAISSVCKSGQTPSRANVLAAIKSTNEATTILGQPISFDAHGDMLNARFFLFKINSAGKYQLIPSS